MERGPPRQALRRTSYAHATGSGESSEGNGWDVDGYPFSNPVMEIDGMWMDIQFHPFTKTCFIGFLSGLESMYELLRVSNHDYGSISPLVGVARCHGVAPSPQPEIASFKTP